MTRNRSRRRWQVAAIQMTSTTDRDRNLRTAARLAHRARESGADLIAFPENFSYLQSEGRPVPCAEPLDGPLGRWLRELARDLGCHLLAGSVPESIPRSRRIHNTSVLYAPDGRRLAAYRKIHLFDVSIRGGAVFRESRTVKPGERTVVVFTPLGKLGLSICYDLRFPELYRRLALRGARVLLIPAAFTAFTGRYHWETLLRARAVENTCWVVAPAQTGRHSPDRESHGHTMVIDPWGTVVARRGRGAGVVMATIDLPLQDRVRNALPSLRHARHGLRWPGT